MALYNRPVSSLVPRALSSIYGRDLDMAKVFKNSCLCRWPKPTGMKKNAWAGWAWSVTARERGGGILLICGGWVVRSYHHRRHCSPVVGTAFSIVSFCPPNRTDHLQILLDSGVSPDDVAFRFDYYRATPECLASFVSLVGADNLGRKAWVSVVSVEGLAVLRDAGVPHDPYGDRWPIETQILLGNRDGVAFLVEAGLADVSGLSWASILNGVPHDFLDWMAEVGMIRRDEPPPRADDDVHLNSLMEVVDDHPSDPRLPALACDIVLSAAIEAGADADAVRAAIPGAAEVLALVDSGALAAHEDCLPTLDDSTVDELTRLGSGEVGGAGVDTGVVTTPSDCFTVAVVVADLLLGDATLLFRDALQINVADVVRVLRAVLKAALPVAAAVIRFVSVGGRGVPALT